MCSCRYKYHQRVFLAALVLQLHSGVLGLPALAQMWNCWCGTSENHIWKRKNAKIELWFFGLVHPCEYLHQTLFCTNEIYQFITSYECNYCACVIKRELLFFIWNENEWALRPRINYFLVKNVFFLFPQQHADNHLSKHNIFWSREISCHVNILGHRPKRLQVSSDGKSPYEFSSWVRAHRVPFSGCGNPASTFFRFRSLLVQASDGASC